jgi:hypothetical protein
MPAVVLEVVFTGPLTRLTVDVGGHGLDALVVRRVKISAGDECIIESPPESGPDVRQSTFHCGLTSLTMVDRSGGVAAMDP